MIRLLAACVVPVVSSVVVASGEPPAPAGEAEGQTEPPAKPLLRGPEVNDTAPPGAEPGFGSMMRAGMGFSQPLEMRSFLELINEIRDAEAPEEVKPTRDQGAQLIAKIRAFRDASRAWQAEHGEELRRLRQERAEGDPQAIRARIQAIQGTAPDVAKAQTELWGLLNEAQRAYLAPKLEAALRDRDAKRNGGRAIRPLPEAQTPAEQRASVLKALLEVEGQITDDVVRAAGLPARLEQRLLDIPVSRRHAMLTRIAERQRSEGERELRERPTPPRMDDVDLPRSPG
ncbi:MAG: hypothetical protein AAGB51_10280 [Planctomycetota bacterium]